MGHTRQSRRSRHPSLTYLGSNLPGYILNALVFLSAKTIANAFIPNKIGDQDRLTAGGQNWTGRALAFDLVDQYAAYADNGALDINQASTDFCFGGRIKTGSDITTFQSVYGKIIAAAVDGRYGFVINAGGLQFYFETSTGQSAINDNITLAVNTEYHVLTRVDRAGKKIYLYIDNVLQNAGGTAYTGTFATLANIYEFYLGAGNAVGGGSVGTFFGGQLRDIRIYHKDVSSSANQTAWMKGERLGDEVAWWYCEDGLSGYVHDAIGDYHLTTANFDSTSLATGMWQSLFNKYGYAIDVASELKNVSNCENLDYTSFANGTPTGFDAVSDGGGAHEAGTADEISIISGNKYLITFDMVLNSGTAPQYNLRYSLAGSTIGGGSVLATAGSNSTTFTASATTVGVLGFFNGSTATNFEITNLKVQEYFETPVPLDMSTANPSTDIFGNTAVFKGQAKYNAISKDRSCFVGDSSAYFDTDSAITIDPDSDTFEIEVKMKIGTKDANYSTLIANKAGNSEARVIINDSFCYFTDDDNNFVAPAIIPSLADDGTYTVKFVGDGSDLKTYVDDVLKDTDSLAGFTAVMTLDRLFQGLSLNTSPSWYTNIYTKITINGSIVANWQFIEGQGSTVYDVSQTDGNTLTGVNVANNNWTVIPTPDECYLSSKGSNFAGQFNGTDDKITLSAPITIDRTKTTVISFRAITDAIGIRRTILGDDSTAFKYMEIDASGNLIIESNSSTDIAYAPLTDNDTDWHDYEITIANSVVSMKQDAVSLVMTDSAFVDDITLSFIGNKATDYLAGKIASLSIVEDGVDIYRSNSLGIDIDGGTWSGTGIHTAIIPGQDNATKLDVLGQTLVYPQNGANLIPQTYFQMPEDIWELYIADQQERYEGGLMDAGKGTFDSGTEGWTKYGNNTIANDENALKITYVDDANGAYQDLASTGDINTNLVIGDEYIIKARVKVNSGSTVSMLIYEGGVLDTINISNTDYEWVELKWDAVSTNSDRILFAMGAGEIIWIDRWELFHKTTQTGNNLITNGGARNDIGALIETDWDKTTGLYDIIAFADYAATVDGATRMNAFGAVGNVSNCVNSGGAPYTSFANGTPTGFDVTSNGVGTQRAGTVDEISFVSGKTYLVEFDLVINSGTAPSIGIASALGAAPISDEGWVLTAAGVNAFIQTANSTTTGVLQFFNSGAASDLEIRNLSVRQTGIGDTTKLVDQMPQGSELVTDGVFEDVTLATAKGLAGITKANPGVVTFDAAHGYADGDVIYFSGLTEMTELNTQYWVLRSNAGDTFELQTTVGASLDTSGYGSAETTGGNVAQKTDFTEWTEGAGWYVGVDGAGALNGALSCDGTNATNTNQGSILTVGKYYIIQYDITAYTSGEVKLFGTAADGAPYFDTIGTHSYVIRATSGFLYIFSSSFNGSVDNISAKELQVLGADLVTDGDFGDVTLAAAKGVAGITKANPGVVSFDAGHGYADGDVIYFSGLTEMTELNGEYWVLRNNATDDFDLQTTVGASLDTSGYGAAETTGGNVAQKTTLTEWNETGGWQPGVDGAGALNGLSNFNALSLSSIGQDVGIEVGGYYLLKFTLSNTSTTGIKILTSAGATTLEIGNTSWLDYADGTHSVMLFCSATTNNRLEIWATTDGAFDIDNVSVHKLTWGRQISDDSTNYSGFQFMLPVDEYDGYFGVDYVAESIVAQQFHDGLADGFSIFTDRTMSYMTEGNGFSGKVQGIYNFGTAAGYFTIALPSTAFDYDIKFKYRTDDSIRISVGAELEDGNVAVNTGDAILYEGKLINVSAATFRLGFLALTAGKYIEVDELEIRPIIDGEFYEPLTISGEAVIVQSDYFQQEPYRYLTRYFDPVNWKNLILVGIDSGLTYAAHLQLLKYTNND